MLGMFLNPGFLFIAIALISVPIIIHLINRMRFKRIRWAAMEFLLKAQKRTRRRLIIEQLLLLALRCFLIGLVGLLVLQFIGCSETGVGGKPNLHVVLLDDSPSMLDQWKLPDGAHDSFDIAREEILIKKIAKNLSLSATNDKLMILPLSKISDPEYQQRKPYERLNDKKMLDELERDIRELKASNVHVNLLQGVKEAQKIAGEFKESQVRLHLVGDFRQPDWGLPAGEGLYKSLLEMTRNDRDLKIRLIDTVHPQRAANQGGYPPSRDNVGIVDFRPSTRIVGKNMPVQFTVAVQNFSGKQVEAMLVARDENTGKDMRDVNFSSSSGQGGARIANTFTFTPSAVTNVTFEYRFNPPNLKPGEPFFAHLSIRLTNPQLQPLQNDALLADNTRHAVVEVRDRVPILVLDGTPRIASKTEEEQQRDSFFVSRSLIAVPGASYQVVYGEEIASGGPTKALERADLSQYPTIFLLNIGEMTAKQVTNLENYVRDGGGVAFFVGPQTATAIDWYNKHLYKEGKGILPAPLRGVVPPLNEKENEAKDAGDTFKLLIRDEKFADPRATPIFGAMFEEPKHREPLRNLAIRRYMQINRAAWKAEVGRVAELATLPNEAPVQTYTGEVLNVTQGEARKAILANAELAKYHNRLASHLKDIETLVDPTSEAKAYHIAAQVEKLLTDKGGAGKDGPPNMTEFFANADPHVQSLRRDLTNLRELVNYGDAFVVSSNFGKGKAVAVMSTAGKEWNDFAGGSAASVLYAPFIWEMQNYLSSQGDEANLSVGSTVDIALDGSQFQGAQLKMVRHFKKTQNEKASEDFKVGEQFGREDGSQLLFNLARHQEPGLYISKVFDENNPQKAPVATYAHVFNIDTLREGQLQRVGDELDRELIKKAPEQISLFSPGGSDSDIIGKVEDLSESPWLFLLFLFVLVAEQALAVHLSYHMRSNEDAAMPVTVGTPKSQAA